MFALPAELIPGTSARASSRANLDILVLGLLNQSYPASRTAINLLATFVPPSTNSFSTRCDFFFVTIYRITISREGLTAAPHLA